MDISFNFSKPINSMKNSQTAIVTPNKTDNRSLKLLYIALTLVLLGNIGGYLVQTNLGKIDVNSLKIPTEDGQWITADLFRPVTATEKTPAPVVVVCPGFERSKETMTAYSIELARRGFVVITIDPYSQGASSSTYQRRSTTTEGNGVIPMVEYIYDTPNINYIDRSRIGAVGYSAGGNAVLQSAARFGERLAKALKQAQRANSDGGKEITDAERARARSFNKIAAIFVGGYVLSMTDETIQPIDANVGMDYAYYDEGAFRNEKGHAIMKDAPEALRLVNSIFPGDTLSSLELGKLYGDPAQRTLRVVYNTVMIHPLMTYDPTHIANVTAYFTTVFAMEPPLAPFSQTWPLKELFGLISLVGGLLFLLPVTSLLLRLPLFSSLVHTVPPALPAPGKKGRQLFWITFAFSAIVACFLFVPLAQATATVFPQASNRFLTWWFPQRINNAILLWAIANGVLGLLLFFLHYALFGKKNGVRPDMWGLRTSIKELLRTFALAVTVLGSFYVMLFASYAVFHTDFRFTFIAAAASFPPKMLIVALEYIPLFFIFYLANSIRVNCGARFEGHKEWYNMLINSGVTEFVEIDEETGKARSILRIQKKL